LLKKIVVILSILIILNLIPVGLTTSQGLPEPLVAPEVYITSPKPGDVIRGNFTIEYTNYTGASDVQFSYYIDTNSDGKPNDGNTWQNIGVDMDLTDNYYFWNTTSTAQGGAGPGDANPVILNATSFDVAFNSKSVYVSNIGVDNTPPIAPILNSIQPNPTNQTMIVISGTSEPFSKLELFIGGVYAEQGTADNAGMFNIDLSISEGSNTVTAQAYDAVGNGPSPLSASRTVTLTDAISPPQESFFIHDRNKFGP